LRRLPSDVSRRRRLTAVESLLTNEALIRGAAFAGILASVAAWELMSPKRGRACSRRQRWPSNLGIVIVNTLLLRLLLPVAAVGVAALAAEHGWGLFRAYGVPAFAAGVSGLLALDGVLYAQHVVFHRVPLLWRLHRLHHADLDVDVTTGVRFHPLEIVLSMLLKMAVVLALGPPVWSVMAFEVILNGASLFNHGNVSIAPGVDRLLRLCVVTPDVHRVHHSVIPRETNSNYGFNLIVWDRLFGTYRAQPEYGHERMRIGLEYFRDLRELKLVNMLLQPFREPGP
jgi:sterol desaturase/sphingolipid hydroxylase (fatty acid hydroxylase superfamily)